MTLTILHYPNTLFNIDLIYKEVPVKVDIHKSIKSKLNPTERLTNEKALKILRQIKLKSDVLSFLTKPLHLFSLGVITFVAAFCIPPAHITLLAIRALTGGLSGAMIGFSVENYFNNALPAISLAYEQQSKRASQYIKILEEDKTIQPSLA